MSETDLLRNGRRAISRKLISAKEKIFSQREFSNWKTKMIREAKKAAASEQQNKPSFVEVKVEKKENGVKRTKPVTDVASSSRIVAEIRFSGGSISIFSEAEAVDVKKIVMALTECANDRTK